MSNSDEYDEASVDLESLRKVLEGEPESVLELEDLIDLPEEVRRVRQSFPDLLDPDDGLEEEEETSVLGDI
jgi:hypothetical protein